ncbi:MAG: RluA family pseudouridine synthase [Acidobacteria bacterium]|nr:RluA family pseudouridine synthase [Acidobacteriota bacterium]
MKDDNTTLLFAARPEDAGKRLDAFLAENVEGWSRSRLQKLITDGDCLVNEKIAKASLKLRGNEEVEIELTELPADIFEPEEIPLNVVYEDEHLAVVNKPSGMVVHPGTGVSSGTLANALAYHFGIGSLSQDSELSEQSKIQNIKSKIGIVHRLDKDTSGLMVVAKSEEILDKLGEQFRERNVFKSYVALVHGEPEVDFGEIEAPIAREKHNRTKMAVRAHGRYALSHWKVKKRFAKFTLVAVEIKTGRTHQIRVHMANINHPIVGDETYNAGRDRTVHDLTIRKAIADLGRFFLHAEKLSFTHPVSGERLNFTASLPPELVDVLATLR